MANVGPSDGSVATGRAEVKNEVVFAPRLLREMRLHFYGTETLISFNDPLYAEKGARSIVEIRPEPQSLVHPVVPELPRKSATSTGDQPRDVEAQDAHFLLETNAPGKINQESPIPRQAPTDSRQPGQNPSTINAGKLPGWLVVAGVLAAAAAGITLVGIFVLRYRGSGSST